MLRTNRSFGERPFIWGTANSAYQCEGAWNEGGKGLGEWDYFNAIPHMNVNSADGRIASDFYHRFREDIDLMADGGQNSVRLSLSWSRIIPQGRGEVNEEAISFYSDVIDYCIERGVEPNVTLFQYDLPYAIALEGGWSNISTSDAFRDYAAVCFERFGDRVRLWSTVDEPQYLSYCSTFLGIYPPCRKLDIQSLLQWQYTQMLASAKAIGKFREMGLPGDISVIHHDCNVEVAPGTKDPEGVRTAADFFYNRMILYPAVFGALPPETDVMLEKLGTYLYRVPGDEEIFAGGVVDFLSLNVFCRKYVTHWGGGVTSASGNVKGSGSRSVEGQVVAPLFETAYDESVEHNQWGRELLPRIMYDSLMRMKEEYGNPYVVAENGHGAYETPDERGFVADDDRIRIIGDFLNHLDRARSAGANVRGYYYWCTMDLYSWINGYDKRYGLVRVDFDDDMRRIPKKSWAWFRDRGKAFG